MPEPATTTVPLDDNFGAGDGVADVAADPVEDTPEAMAAKAKAYDERNAGETPAEPDTSGVPAMPAGGHEKFYNKATGEYNWENHSTELQFKLDNQQPGEPTAPKKVQIKEPKKGGEVDPTAQMQQVFDTMAEDFETNGELSEANRKTLGDMGFPKAVVDTYLNGLQATNELTATKSTEIMGSQEKLDAVMKWASGNMTAAQRTAINADLANPEMLEITLLGLQARYNNAIGTDGEPALIDGDATGGEAVVAYETAEQHRADIKKPEYKTSPKFRQEVMRKLAASTW